MAWRMQKKRSLRAAGRIGVDNRGKRGRGRGRGRQRRKTEDGRRKTEGRRQKTEDSSIQRPKQQQGPEKKIDWLGAEAEMKRVGEGWGGARVRVAYFLERRQMLRCVVLCCVALRLLGKLTWRKRGRNRRNGDRRRAWT
jgi:hypothetical protein